MTDTTPTEPTAGPIPADDPARVLTHACPDTDDSLPHIGVAGATTPSWCPAPTRLGATP